MTVIARSSSSFTTKLDRKSAEVGTIRFVPRGQMDLSPAIYFVSRVSLWCLQPPFCHTDFQSGDVCQFALVKIHCLIALSPSPAWPKSSFSFSLSGPKVPSPLPLLSPRLYCGRVVLCPKTLHRPFRETLRQLAREYVSRRSMFCRRCITHESGIDPLSRGP